MSVYDGGELFPRNATCAPAWSLAAESAQRKWPPASAQTQDIVCSVDVPRQWTVVLIKSENHARTKFWWKQVKAGAGWRGDEDGGVPASPYLKKGKQVQIGKKKVNLNSNTKLKIKLSITIINPVFIFSLARVFEIK